jgi:preprotein translocase subunit SecA
MIDTLWVEHLEVMNYTRNSVNLRAYGQRDPLVEYRTEGTRLFAEMKVAVLSRILEVLPRMVPQIVEREAAALQKQAEAVIASSAQKTEQTGSRTPAVASDEPNRNEIVTITNGTETKELKYKKASEFLTSGWVLKK